MQKRLEDHVASQLFRDIFEETNELDGCQHVYLDVGSNIGVQVRKLFEPNLYPNATVIEIFEKYFGPDFEVGAKKGAICAVGFEPNEHHTTLLRSIEETYKQCGWKAKFYTQTAVSHTYGEVDFISDGDTQNKECKNF